MTLFLYKSLNLKHEESLKTNMKLNLTYLNHIQTKCCTETINWMFVNINVINQNNTKRQTKFPLKKNFF